MKSLNLDINGRKNPVGLDENTLVLHYAVENNCESYTAYELTVTDSEKNTVWHQNVSVIPELPYLLLNKENLQPETAYTVSLTMFCGDEPKAEGTVSFETGICGGEWTACWIEPEQENAEEEETLSFFEMLVPNPKFFGGEKRLKPVQQLRKTFSLNAPACKARVYATAHGIYELWLNGKRVSDHYFAPENTAYQKILYYQTYDVTDLLKEGENIITAYLADGWWIGRLGMPGDSCNYGNRLALLLQMKIETENGETITVVSDEDFHSRPSYIEYSDLYIGERQDLQKKQEESLLPGFSEEGWAKCMVADYPMDNLTGQIIEPVVVIDELQGKIVEVPNGELVYDFGQVIAGIGSFEIQAPAGQQIVFEHSEVLDREGNFKCNIIGRNKDQKDVLVTCEGLNYFEPHFTYHGFRYIRVTGAAKEQLLSVRAKVLSTRMESVGTFSCSNEKLNRLQHNIVWSTKANMFSVPTDCPQREKLGWTGDIQVFTPTGAFNYDLLSFLDGWMMNLRAEQCEDGEVPVVVPNPKHQEKTQRAMSCGSNSSAAWGDACVMVPYYLYRAYGDTRVLRENFDSMWKWYGYVRRNAESRPENYDSLTTEEKARNPYLWTKQFHFGDWLIPSLREKEDGVMLGVAKTGKVVGSCYYAIMVQMLAEIAGALDEKEKQQELLDLLPKIQAAVRDEYVKEDGTVFEGGLQGLYVIILHTLPLEETLRAKVFAKLVELIEQNDYCLDTGFSSVSYLLDVLCENGRKDLAYRILLQEKAPSWLYMVDRGATTMWENWKAITVDGEITDSSYNHYAFGCVGDFIYRHIGGLQPQAAGYSKVLLAPDLGYGITEASIAHVTPYGKLTFQWKESDGQVLCSGFVPAGVDAMLKIGAEEKNLQPGNFSIAIERK